MSKHHATSSETERRILRVLDYIHDHPDGDLSLDALADVAAMSRFHWHRVYRAIAGETAAQTVRRMRLNRAAVDLIRTDRPIERIGASVGYPNAASFNRVFAEAYGLSPLAFRARGTMQTPLGSPQKGVTSMTEYKIEIRTEPDRRLAAMPHTGPYQRIDRAFEKLAGVIGARGLFEQTAGMVGVFYNDPSAVAEADLRSHAGFVMAQTAEIAAPLEVVDLPGGKHAVLTFKDPYTGLPDAYDDLFARWLPQSGEAPADQPSFEVYLNSPMDTAPDDLLTEIHLPLA